MAVSRRVFVATATVLAATGATRSALAAPAAETGDSYRIPVSPDDTEADLVRKASQVRPTARQIAWQRLERTARLGTQLSLQRGQVAAHAQLASVFVDHAEVHEQVRLQGLELEISALDVELGAVAHRLEQHLHQAAVPELMLVHER